MDEEEGIMLTLGSINFKSGGLIAAIAIVVLVILSVIAVCIWCCITASCKETRAIKSAERAQNTRRPHVSSTTAFTSPMKAGINYPSGLTPNLDLDRSCHSNGGLSNVSRVSQIKQSNSFIKSKLDLSRTLERQA